MLALPLPLNFFEPVPDLPVVCLSGGAMVPESIVFLSLPQVAVQWPVMPQNVHDILRHMHDSLSWLGLRHLEQMFWSLDSSLPFPLLFPPPLLFPLLPLLFDLALMADPLFCFPWSFLLLRRPQFSRRCCRHRGLGLLVV